MAPLRDTVTRAVVRTKALLGIERPIFMHPALPASGGEPNGAPHPKGIFTIPELSGCVSTTVQSLYGVQALSNQEVAAALLMAVEYVSGSDVEGDVCEFGSMTGRTSRVIAAAMAACAGLAPTPKTLHLFDSFEGLPVSTSEVDRRSVHVATGVWGPGTCKGITPQELRSRCEEYLTPDRVKIYEGWFSKTVPQVPPGTRFALLHVDCDLYQSALDCLDPLFAKAAVSQGAAILFDDWNCNRAANELGERLAWAELSKKYSISCSDWGPYGWAGHKFIVHGYAGAPAASSA